MLLIGGLTGSGKTALLGVLRAAGEPVVDLEALAHHRGSAFGATDVRQPSHRGFVRAVRAAIAAAGDHVWLEDEGPFIGSVGLPPTLYAQLVRAPVIELERPRAARIATLVATYASHPNLAAAVNRIAPRLGVSRTSHVRAALAAGALAVAAEVLLEYYDTAYRRRIAGWDRPVIARISADDPGAAACAIAVAARWRCDASATSRAGRRDTRPRPRGGGECESRASDCGGSEARGAPTRNDRTR